VKLRMFILMTAIVFLAALMILVRLAAQEPQNETATSVTANPVPSINQPLLPDAIRPGGAGFTLTVNGTGFVSGSVVKWNGSARTTKFVSRSRLTATVLSSDVAKPGTASVRVLNPSPGGCASNIVFFEVTLPGFSIVLRPPLGFGAASGPGAVVTGDFNEDDKLDLIV